MQIAGGFFCFCKLCVIYISRRFVYIYSTFVELTRENCLMFLREIFTLVAAFCFSPQNICVLIYICAHLHHTETNVVVCTTRMLFVLVRGISAGAASHLKPGWLQTTTRRRQASFFFFPRPFNGFFLYRLNTQLRTCYMARPRRRLPPETDGTRWGVDNGGRSAYTCAHPMYRA